MENEDGKRPRLCRKKGRSKPDRVFRHSLVLIVLLAGTASAVAVRPLPILASGQAFTFTAGDWTAAEMGSMMAGAIALMLVFVLRRRDGMDKTEKLESIGALKHAKATALEMMLEAEEAKRKAHEA